MKRILLLSFILLTVGINSLKAQIDAPYIPEDPGPIPKERLVTEKWFYGIKEALSVDPATVYKMSLRGNKIKRLTPEIGQFYNLQILILSNCKMKQLPDEISKLKNLQELNIFNNRLVTLPEGLGSLRNLEVFLAAKNRLIYLPSSIRTLEHLHRMDISYNNLSPNDIEELVEALPDCKISY
jgi:Leucine-rich repeat (LRR) protein